MLAFALFLTLPAAVAVNAQSSGWWGQDNNRRDRREDRRERRRERREDRRERRDDRRDDRRNGTWDGYGNNGGYGNGGYGNDGYYGNGGYGNSQLRQTALNAGYNEGIKEGRNDRNRRERFDYRDEGDYQNASKDYNSRLGDRGQYQQYFRQGFANGYRDGYNGY
jgi:transcription termination factor Rho